MCQLEQHIPSTPARKSITFSQPEPPVKDREEKGRISRRKGRKSERKIDILIATYRRHHRRPVAARPGHPPQTLLNRIQSVGPCDLTKTKPHCPPLFCHCSQRPPHKLSCGDLSIYRLYDLRTVVMRSSEGVDERGEISAMINMLFLFVVY